MAVKANSAVQSSAAESSSNRRTIIKGAAWSVPVIAAAVAAPAASASVVPVVERFNFSGGTSSSTVGGEVKNVQLNGGNFALEAPVGTATGEVSLLVTFPDGYLSWTPIGELFGWTAVDGVDDSGYKTVTFTHPGVAVTTAGQPATMWFAGIVLEGAGATKRNYARFDFACENFTGGSLLVP